MTLPNFSQGQLAAARADTVLESLIDPMAWIDANGCVYRWNPAAEAFYGWPAAQALGRPLSELIGRSINDTEASQRLAQAPYWDRDEMHHDRSGVRLDVRCRYVRLDGSALTRNHYALIIRDLSAQAAESARLRDNVKLLCDVMDNTSSYIHVRDPAGVFLYVNKEYQKVFGYPIDGIIGKSIEEVLPPARAHARRKTHDHIVRTGGSEETEVVQMRGDVSRTYLDVKAPLFDEVGRVKAVYCIGTDITARKAAEARVLKLAHYDAVTDLPNRILFSDRLGEAVRKAPRTGHRIGLLYLDLDRFKDINDTLGHASGDQLLVEAARRIQAAVRATDTVARMGGDEFTVMLEGLEGAEPIGPVAEQILAALAAPFQLRDDEVFITASIGITVFPADGADAETLLKNADQAMYLAKRSGGNRYGFFTAAMQEAATTQLTLKNDLRTALRDGQFFLVYQPIVSLSDYSIHKAEALIRWQHPVRGLISPLEFVALSEANGMIVPIGEWVFQEAIRQCAQWRRSHDPRFQVSINTSPAQYQADGIDIPAWGDALARHGLGGDALTVEITEGLLMEANQSVASQLRECRNRGMHIALDDFGTGYSSLSYLKKFDVDYLKIDRSFVSSLAPGSDDLALCEAIIVMAHKLGIKVVAEGIETAAQSALLREAGCDFGQGYHFSRPVDAAQFSQLLDTRCA